ncbi:MAG: ABC transporter substrate-binding protein [Candidatus Eisenbacteria bacterium]
MSRKTIAHLAVVGIAVLTLGLEGGCAEKAQPRRVGVLCGLNYISGVVDGLRAKMTDLGWVEGRDIVYIVERTNFEPDREKAIIERFVEDEVDVVLSCPTEASILSKNVLEGTGIPLVFTYANIEDMGIVESIRHPGGNVTGVRYPGPDIAVQRLEILLEIVPSARALLVPYQRGYPIVPLQIEVLDVVAEKRGVKLVYVPADNGADLKHQIAALAPEDRDSIDGILIIVEPLAVSPDAFSALAEFARPRRLPCGGALMVTDGYRSLFSANSDIEDSGRQAAVQVDRVLKGASAGDLPVLSAEASLEIVNGAAHELGVTIPEGVLARATVVHR